MDDLSEYNRERWNALAEAGVEYSRPWLDLDEETARRRVDPLGLLGDLADCRVLLLAGGGGQQSAAFAMLGATVTVFDLSDVMLARDRETADHYGHEVTTIRGDVRDMSALASDSFDHVWQAHSLSFVSDLDAMYDGVARVLRVGGLYHQSAWNPLAYAADSGWNGRAYEIQGGYAEGREAHGYDDGWDLTEEAGNDRRVRGPREFRHTLTATINGLIARGFLLLDVHEESNGDPSAEPGTWAHFSSVVPPWLVIWAALRPDVLRRMRES
jgi:SAM-dependent methyltransferase